MSLKEIQRRYKELPIGLIDPPDNPSRGAMDEEKLEELARSIRGIGLQQPMIVYGSGERYKVIAGHRRRLACERAGLVEAPCIIYPSQDDALYAIQHAENRFREDLSVGDEAIWFQELLAGACENDVDKICGLVGEKRSYVEGRLALIQGDEKIFDALCTNQIKIGVAHELNRITDEQIRRYYLACAIRDGSTVALVVGWVAQWRASLGASDGIVIAPHVSSSAAPADAYDPHRCYVCKKSDPRYLPDQIAVHRHCLLAILDPLLAGEVPAAGG